MAHKTFISYKYSESIDLRDRIIDALGDDATYYKGETADSPDMTGEKPDKIKAELKDMIFDTSVTIVIISPKMKESKWIDWEIEYSLKEITRADRTSRSNGLLGVIQSVNGSYDWFIKNFRNSDGCSVRYFEESYLYNIIIQNRYNQSPLDYICKVCKTMDRLSASYISFIEQDEFISNSNFYIENAFDKAQNISEYNITKLR